MDRQLDDDTNLLQLSAPGFVRRVQSIAGSDTFGAKHVLLRQAREPDPSIFERAPPSAAP